jgi:hypothetical protein
VARIRTIKPEFWTDETITECSLSTRLLFIGIWNFADDAGNLDRSAKQIKARVFPVDNVDCEPLIQELITHGLLIEYSVSMKKYLHIPGFADHQVINRPSKPVVPPPSNSPPAPVVLSEPSVSTHAGREGKGREGIAPKSPRGRKTGLPSDFTLTPELSTYVETTIPLADPPQLFAKFLEQAKAKAWEYADWRMAFQTYCRNCKPDSGHFAAGQFPRKTSSSIHAGVVMR